MRSVFGLIGEHDCAIDGYTPTLPTALMAIHKKILERQAAHPNITWIGWGVVWLIVLGILLWPRRSS
jgi:hypothetical protein